MWPLLCFSVAACGYVTGMHFRFVDDVIFVHNWPVGLPLTSIYLLEYSSEYLNEYSSTR